MENNLIDNYISKLRETLLGLDKGEIYRIADMVSRALGRIYIIGNGGSASTAQHFAQGLMDAGKQATSLSDNAALITALANDISYDQIFTKQLENIIDVGDVLIAISGSGDSKNLVNAMEFVREYGDVRKIALLGFGGGKLRDMVDECIVVPDDDYGRIEDVHLALCHIISYIVKSKVGR